MRKVIALIAASCAASWVASAGAESASKAVGTWTGTIGPVPICGFCIRSVAHYRPSAKLVVSAGGSATATFSGLTGASHDPSNLTTTCAIRYRFARQTGQWSYYTQSGAVQLTSRGYVENAPCINLGFGPGHRDEGGNALRVVKVAPDRVRADFGEFEHLPSSPLTFDFVSQVYRGYLRQ
jgi:hypothetical protein